MPKPTLSSDSAPRGRSDPFALHLTPPLLSLRHEQDGGGMMDSAAVERLYRADLESTRWHENVEVALNMAPPYFLFGTCYGWARRIMSQMDDTRPRPSRTQT